MKLQLEVNLPDDTSAIDVQNLLTEFHWLARIRGWRSMLVLPKKKAKTTTVEDRAQG